MTNTLHISNRAASKRMAQRFAEDVADGLAEEAKVAVDHAERLIATLRGAGAGAYSVAALKDALEDCFNDCQGTIDRTLDNEGMETDGRHKLDLTGIEEA